MSSWLRKLTLSAFMAGALASPSSSAEPIIRDGYVVVKLRPQAVQTLRNAKSAMVTGLPTLDKLNVQYNIRDFRQTVPSLSGMSASAGPVRDVHGLSRYYTVELQPGTDVLTAIAAYAADPNVELAEPDYIVPLELIPNDPDYGEQWTHFDTFNKDIDTQQGWDLELGDSTVIVGVIDSGIQYDHPDLNKNVWVNPGEDLDGDGVPWDPDDMNGLDDDGNSLVDDLIGWDFMPVQGGCAGGEDCNGPDNNPIDFNGHGTHVNGIVGAVTGNGTGGAGVAGGNRAAHHPGVKLMGLRAGYEASDGNGFVIMTACAAATDYAVAKGAFGINCSWGSSGSLIRTAILNAVANGLVVCKASGNDNVNTPDIIDTTFGVLAVSSLEDNGSKSSFSNYGTWVDISAPGGVIYNTYSNSGVPAYAYLSGTSMASPTVLGVAALLKSHHSWFTKTEIDTLLMNYAADVDIDNPSFAGQLGSGRVNANNSLSILTTADYDVDTNFGFAPLTVNFTDASQNAPSGPYEYDFGDGTTEAGPNASHQYTLPGLYTIKYTGNGPSGPHTRTRYNHIVVVQDTVEYGDTTGISVGQKVAIPIRLRNTHPVEDISLPFRLTGPASIVIDSLTLTPLTANWDKFKANDGSTTASWRLRSYDTAAAIPPGSGIIAHAWIRVVSGSAGQTETIDSMTFFPSQNTIRLISDYANFKPRFIGGSATIGSTCDCSCNGDPLCDGFANVQDVVSVVNVAFRGQLDTVDGSCPHVGRSDLNCDCIVNVQDVVAMVNRAFRGDTTPPCDICANPCF